MNRNIKNFGLFVLPVIFCVLICGCSNKSMFLDQAKSAVTAFNENGVYFPDLKEDVLADIIEEAYVSDYNKKYDSYEYVLSFTAADTFKIDPLDFTVKDDISSRDFAEEFAKYIDGSLKKSENVQTKKNYSVKCTFEKNNKKWHCKIDPEDMSVIKSAGDLYAQSLFEEKINNSETYRNIVARELEPFITEFIDSELSYPVIYGISVIESASKTAQVRIPVTIPDFKNYYIENPDALLPEFDFKSIKSNPYDQYRQIFRDNIREYAEKKEHNEYGGYDINLSFVRNNDGAWEKSENDSSSSEPAEKSVARINTEMNSQAAEILIKAVQDSDIMHILSRYYGGDLFNEYPDYLNCAELADFISVEDIKILSKGKYEITLRYPALDELTAVAETNFRNSITQKYFEPDDIVFDKNNIGEFYGKSDVAEIKNTDSVTFTYDGESSVSDNVITEKFEAMIKKAREEADRKWLVKDQSYPSSGVLYNNSGGGNSFINFYKFPGAEVCYYKLYNSSDKLVVTMFLNTDSDSIGLYLPSGTYYLKYSYGSKWYGTDDAFGTAGSYGKSEPFVVLYGYMYDYAFVYSGGNSDLDAIDRSDF